MLADNAGNTLVHRDHETEKYNMFKTMMNAFEDERKVMEKAYKDLQHLLSQATRDVIYLSQQNDYLNTQLTRVILYEPPIQPSRGHSEMQAPCINGKPTTTSRAIFFDGAIADESALEHQSDSLKDRSITSGSGPPTAPLNLPPLQVNGFSNATENVKKQSPIKSPKNAHKFVTKGAKFKFGDDENTAN